jgi:hypothetical protein
MKTLLALLCLGITHLHAQQFDRYGGSAAIMGKATDWFRPEEVNRRFLSGIMIWLIRVISSETPGLSRVR